MGIVATYIVTTMAYTLWLKHIAVIDLIAIASGFVFHATAGAVAVDVAMSKWFVSCTTFGSLFIVTGKRYPESRELGADGRRRALHARRVHARVPADHARGLVRWGDGRLHVGVGDQGAQRQHAAVLRAVDRSRATALLRYLLVLENGGGAAPEEVFAQDRVLQVMGVAWVVLFGLGVLPAVTTSTIPGFRDDVAGWLTEAQAACSPTPRPGAAGRRDRRDRQLPGRSTIVLAAAAPDATVMAIDPHAGNDRGPGEIDGFAVEAAADRATFKRNLDGPVSTTASATCRPSPPTPTPTVHGPIDLLYVDGAHRYAPARADIRDWGARVVDGGGLLMHDAFSSIGVTLAIGRELLFGRRFRFIGRSRSLASYRADLPPGRGGPGAQRRPPAVAARVVHPQRRRQGAPHGWRRTGAPGPRPHGPGVAVLSGRTGRRGSHRARGWGHTMPSAATLARVGSDDVEGLRRVLKEVAGRGALARGLGRSYSDAAQNAGGAALDMTGSTPEVELDRGGAPSRPRPELSLDA